MKWLQNGNLAKLVAFFVIAIVISCTVSFAANGWQSFVDDDTNSDSTATDNNPKDENENSQYDDNSQATDAPVVLPEPKYYHAITGLEVDSESSLKRPICLVFSSQDPLYGISSSYLTIEIPTEYGNTRLLCFTDDAKTLGKIGSLAPSRGYISNLASYFGGILLSYGTDDSIEYNYKSPDAVLDFEKTIGYCYSEYNSFVYTNADLVSAFLNNSKINQSLVDEIVLPYTFASGDERLELKGESANSVSILYSDGNSSQLSYSVSEKCYLLSKNSSVKTDLLNDKTLKYDNAFILYANSTTYESEESTQLILDTYSKGDGIYMSGGRYMQIFWERTTDGNLLFYDSDGNKLTVNCGTSYIGFVKSSMKPSVKIS